MIGQTLGHFRIVRKIGAGGMGEVYAARDTRLDRDVACKVLPAGSLADDEARARFRKEALALGRLNHPNIASVYDFDTQEGIDFLVMEYIDGVSLNEKLAAGPLPEKTIAHLAAQMADGLSSAHDQGVIHRDLKPRNLRVTGDGRLKILDFGLAKFVKTGTDDATTVLSQAYQIVGTLPYMAPEQLRGELVDHRTDLYALGVVLYEMATGRCPFEHAAAAALAAEIQYKAPPSPRDLQPHVSPQLEALILKCLEKDPAHRYQSAREVGADVRRLLSVTADATSAVAPPAPTVPSRRLWFVGAGALAVMATITAIGLNLGGARDRLAGARGGAAIRSLAVLPLEDLSGDASQEYFADGMTEALIADLSKVRAIRVISRTSVMQFKHTTSTVPAIARDLGVDAVVQGSVQRAGNRVRIRAQLIRAQPEEHLWVNDFDREITDVLDLQRELSAAVASEIRVSLTAQEEARLARARSVRPEVYDAYLRGRYQLGSPALDNWRSSLTYFEEALRLDPGYAPAHAALAEAQIARGFVGAGQPREILEKARAAAARALQLDDSLADAHAAMGWVRTVADWQWAEAEREFRRALDLDPSSAAAHSVYSTLLSALGRHDEAIAEGRIALELDPLSLQAVINLGWRFQGARLYDQAIDQYKKAMAMGPAAQVAASNLAEVYALLGRLAEARAEVAKLRPFASASPGMQALLAPVYAAAGMREEARVAIDQANLLRQQGVYPSSTRLGLASAFLGDRDRAFAELERAFQERDLWMIFLAWLPKPDWLRADPRYLDLTARINLPG